MISEGKKCRIKDCENKAIFVIYSHDENQHIKEICNDCAIKYFNLPKGE